MIQGLDYFYDRQQPRFLEQIIRAFSGFQYMSGSRAGLPPALVQVPCRLASTNSVVANIIKNQSANTLNTVPMITVWQTGLQLRNDDLQNRNHVDTRQVVERDIDPDTGAYTSARGQSYTVQRIMPLPFTMLIQVDVWTSNLDQKYQLEEQILTIMAPSFDIQNSDNALDWTALTTVYFEEINHTSKSIPIGTSTDEIDIMTFQLRLPIWLSPPAKVKQQTIIQQIVTNVSDTEPLPGVIMDAMSEGSKFLQSVVTPGNHHIRVEDGIITLLGPGGAEHDPQGEAYVWRTLLDYYGFLRPAASQLSLKIGDDIEGTAIVGTIQYDQNDTSNLLWVIDPDTLPANTLQPVSAVIDPHKTYPITGGLPSPVEGARYLILNDIGPCEAWGDVTASMGDIIQFHSGAWTVSFHTAGSGIQYVLNSHSGRQLRWTGDDWVLAIDGTYGPGYWRLNI
jgi:hypothetical protein